MYIKLTNGIPENYSIGQLRRDNPQTSFPKNPSDSLLAEWNIFPLSKTDNPAYDGLTQTVKEDTPVQIDGVWTQQWVVENKSQEEAEANIRNIRDSLLSESDWTQGKDISDNISQTWAVYRQALRDIPQQIDFPWNIAFPIKPE